MTGPRIFDRSGEIASRFVAWRATGLNLLVGLCLAMPAYAQVDLDAPDAAEGDDLAGWEVGVQLNFGVHTQSLDGTAIVPDSLDRIRFSPTDPSEPDVSSGAAPGDSATTPYLGGTLRLYAPEDLFGARLATKSWMPRLLLEAGAEAQLDNAFRASRYDFNFDVLDDPGGMTGPADFCPQEPPDPVDTCSYSSRTTVDLLANWMVGIGADFKLPTEYVEYHLVPTFGYFGQAYESQGDFTVTLSQGLGTDDDRTIRGSGDVEILHGLYAGLGLGVDVWESDGMTARLSLNGRVAWIYWGSASEFSAVNPVPTPNFSSANFSIEPQELVINAFAGVEIRFDPAKMMRAASGN